MENDAQKELKNIHNWIIGISIIALTILILIMSFSHLRVAFGSEIEESSITESILTDNGTATTLKGTSTSLTATTYNNTWLSFDGVNDLVNISISGQANTLSFWYKNDTVDWTHLVQTLDLIYINGSYESDWGFTPYQILNNLLYVAYDGTDYYEIEIDDVRVLSSYLNSTQVEELYNQGR